MTFYGMTEWERREVWLRHPLAARLIGTIFIGVCLGGAGVLMNAYLSWTKSPELMFQFFTVVLAAASVLLIALLFADNPVD